MNDASDRQHIGPYRLGPVLGRGAMGVVYRAFDPVGGRPVALKTIRSDVLAGAERGTIEARFAREAELGLRLDHPHIVRIYDHGRDAGTLFLAMELIAGKELRELIEKGPPLPLDRKIAIIGQLLEALAYAHSQGIVHRDIKPSNLLIDAEGRVKLMDFGIAHVAHSEVTRAGELLGSPAYMAPEQLQGVAVDARADIFAAGALLYTLLTGQRPFTGALGAILHQVLFVDPPAPSTVNPALTAAFDGVIRDAMAKDRERRFADAAAFAAALQAAREAAGAAGLAAADPDDTVLNRRSGPVAASPARLAADLAAATGRLAGLIEECLAKRVTEKRLDAVRSAVGEWIDLAGRLPAEPRAGPRSAAADRLAALVTRALDALADLIVAGAPAPGRAAGAARSDWHGLTGLFSQLRLLAERLGAETTARLGAERIAVELAGVFFAYSPELNRLLFGEGEPDLLRIAGDFMRLEIIQLGLEEIGAARQAATVRGTMLMFASQVMRKANLTIARFARTGDEAARQGVALLLAEVEELIVMAGRLLERDEHGHPDALGDDVVAEFVENAIALARITAAELDLDLAGDTEEGAFAGKLAQLASIYRFATRLPGGSFGDRLQLLTGAVHQAILGLAEAAIGRLEQARLAGEAAAESRCQVLLTALYDTVEEFGWAGVAGSILTSLRNAVVPAGR